MKRATTQWFTASVPPALQQHSDKNVENAAAVHSRTHLLSCMRGKRANRFHFHKHEWWHVPNEQSATVWKRIAFVCVRVSREKEGEQIESRVIPKIILWKMSKAINWVSVSVQQTIRERKMESQMKVGQLSNALCSPAKLTLFVICSWGALFHSLARASIVSNYSKR